ncbi:hypothetical protein ZWY2020_001461 [Hordeum vulgare]|nr:hypothetical protein ZWY2020_001461 [Hordeum vulgare]
MAGATALRGGGASICSRKPPSQPGQASPASPSVRTNRGRFPSSCQFILFQRGFVLDYFICLVISDKYSQSENGAEPELDPMELYDNEESRSHTVDDSNAQSSMDVDRKQLSVDADMNGKPSLDGDGKGKYSESHAEVPIDMSLGSLESNGLKHRVPSADS